MYLIAIYRNLGLGKIYRIAILAVRVIKQRPLSFLPSRITFYIQSQTRNYECQLGSLLRPTGVLRYVLYQVAQVRQICTVASIANYRP